MSPIRTGLAVAALATALATPLHAGDVFRDLDGRARDLAAEVGGGKWTVVMLWASDCEVCNQEAAGLNAFHERHKGSDARMLGLAIDGEAGEADARAFVARHRLTFDNLLAEPEDAAALYARLTGRRWIGTPTFLVYGPDGTLLAQQVGAIEIEVIESFIASRAGGG